MVEVVDTPEEAIAAANGTMDGLTSSILAGNTYKAFEMAPKVLAGIVNVNSPTVNDEIHVPMGGVRDSGWGRTGPGSASVRSVSQCAGRRSPATGSDAWK